MFGEMDNLEDSFSQEGKEIHTSRLLHCEVSINGLPIKPSGGLEDTTLLRKVVLELVGITCPEALGTLSQKPAQQCSDIE